MRSAGGGNYGATVAAPSVVFVRPLVCSVMLQYLVLFGAPSLDTSKTYKPALVSLFSLILEKHSGEIDVPASDTRLANCMTIKSRSRRIHYSGQPATKFDQL